MNTYVMSDIHGCYDEFQRMLTKIKFGKDDFGYIESLENVDTEEIYNSLEDLCLYARDDAYMCG